MFTHWNDCVVTWFSIIKCTIYSMSPYLQSFVWIRAALVVIKSDDLVYILVQQKYVTLPHFNFVAIVWLLMLNRCTTLKSPHAEWLNASPPCFGNDSAEYRSVMTGRLSWRQCNTLHDSLKFLPIFFLPTPDTMTNALFMTCVGCISTKNVCCLLQFDI